MVFYKSNLTEITKQHLLDAIVNNNSEAQILHFNFIGHPEIKLLSEALDVIETKRKSLKNPYNHSFLCLHLIYNGTINLCDVTEPTDMIAQSIYDYYNQDVFLFSFAYVDINHAINTVICISDIEPSLEKSSINSFDYDMVNDIIRSISNAEELSDTYYSTLISFKGISKALPYDGVLHIKQYVI